MFDHGHRAQQIQLVALDVDGVLTDGSVIYSNSGDETKAFNIKDGLGIKWLQRAGIEVAIITGRSSALLERRARELGITAILQGREDKSVALKELLDERGLDFGQCAYIGDDLPDLSAIIAAGLGSCPADAAEIVRDAADWVATARGGHGAVREFAEMLLHSRGQLTDILESYR